MSRIKELAELGQSIWYDFIRRSLMNSGELKSLIDEGLRGMTSNPTIFEKAIAGSSDYDSDMTGLVKQNKSINEIYEALVLEDIRQAADLLRPVYDKSDGGDGFVSLEVDPKLAYQTKETITEAKRLFTTLNRPNIMIKVPATEAGLPAVTELIGSGINVNVTLIFSLENYKKVAEAYLKGLEKLQANPSGISGRMSLDKVSSVASFFVSRVDTAFDAALEEKGNKKLQGKLAVANAKVSYDAFQKIFSGDRWEKLAAKGARKQRVLWASTSTKNPKYSPLLYVEELIGPKTVNTLPPATYKIFQSKGKIARTLTAGLEEANSQISQLSNLGINYREVTQKLQDDGVAAFVRSFESLLQSIAEKREKLLKVKEGFSVSLGEFQPAAERTLEEMENQKVVQRIREHDYTVWEAKPDGITNRLGWLNSPQNMQKALPEIKAFVEQVKAEGFTHALLLGMGGSSLAPEVFRLTFGVKKGCLNLAVLDSTDPGAVLEYSEKLNPAKTLYIVSTKSGGTVETISFMKYFYNQTLHALGEKKAGKHFTAITDPGSALESLAKKLKFRNIFLNDPNIGGRYSALSYFGLVPAALIGVDIAALLERAAEMAGNCTAGRSNSCTRLGAIMGELALLGRDKLTFVSSPAVAHFGIWAEQLIAESTGKEGRGILPVDGEANMPPDFYGNDRLFIFLRLQDDETYDMQIKTLIEAGEPVVQIDLQDLYDMGGEFFRWEVATAIAGWKLKINPFDQPNVESAKVAARKMAAAYQKEGSLPELKATFEDNGISVYSDFPANNLKEAFLKFLTRTNYKKKPGSSGYIAVQAYVKPSSQTDAALLEIRTKLFKKYRLATTVGYGPRFLHSTGQLHKGDAGKGMFIQIVADAAKDVLIPDQPGAEASSISFGVLKMAQSLGDRQALLDGGRKVIRLHITDDVEHGLKKIAAAI